MELKVGDFVDIIFEGEVKNGEVNDEFYDLKLVHIPETPKITVTGQPYVGCGDYWGFVDEDDPDKPEYWLNPHAGCLVGFRKNYSNQEG